MKKVRLSEEAYEKLKRHIVNEISFGKVDKADDVSYEIFNSMKSAFDDFYIEVRYNADKNNPYVQKIRQYADAINDILEKKTKQAENFGHELDKVDREKFYSDEDREDDDYDNLDLRQLQVKYPR